MKMKKYTEEWGLVEERKNAPTDITSLMDILIHLHKNYTERRQRVEATEIHTSTMIPSWDNRIDDEITLLEKITTERST